jgi:hypothetical protein
MQDWRDRLDNAVQHGTIALAAAQLQYSQGPIDFRNVLSVQNRLLGAQSALVQATADTLARLYKALGGGWQQTYPGHPPRRSSGRATDAGKPAPRRTDGQRHPAWSGPGTNGRAGHRLVDRMIRFMVERHKNSLRRARRAHPGGS